MKAPVAHLVIYPKPKSSKKKRNPAVNAKASCITDVEILETLKHKKEQKEAKEEEKRMKRKNKKQPKTRVTSKNSY